MRFFRKKQIGRALEPVKKATGKITLAEKNRIATEMVRQIEQTPEILDEVLRQLYEKGLEIPASVRDEISTQVIQAVSASGKVPDASVVEATKTIVEQLSDNKVAELARNVDLGIEEKNAIVETGISDEEKKREEKVNLAIDNLYKLYNKVDNISKDSDIAEEIEKIMKNLPKTEEAEQYKIDQLVNSIIAKKIMQNYIRFGRAKFHLFSKIQSPEELFASNIPQLAKCEYKNIPTSVREQYSREYKEEVCRRELLEAIADRVATEFSNDSFKKIRIPQSKQMQNISEEEEQYFLEKIKQRVEKLNGTINPLTELDIREQIRGNIKTAEQVGEYVATMDQLPKGTKESFIQQGREIMSSKDLLEISYYCNQAGLYPKLASLGVDKAKKLIDKVIQMIEDRHRSVASREETPKVKRAEWGDDPR